MKKIDGLKVCFKSGEGSLALPPEFTGQDIGLQLTAISSWLIQLDRMREELFNGVSEKHKAFFKGSTTVTLEELLTDEYVLYGMRRHKSGKRALYCHKTSVSGKYGYVFESNGFDGFRQIYISATHGFGTKSGRRWAKKSLDFWEAYRDYLSSTPIAQQKSFSVYLNAQNLNA